MREQPLIEALHQLSNLAMRAKPDASDVSEACHVIRQALNASDAYVVRSGDPSFVRIGCDCPPTEYEIKQKGYFLIWREAIAHPEFAAGLFDVVDRIVSLGTPIAPRHPCTHLATLLPGDESNSELLIVRGPWPQGLSMETVRFVDVARPLVAHLVNNALDRERERRQRIQLEAMADIARAFSEARGTENVLEALATALAKASGFDWVTMSIYDEECRRTIERAINVARHSETETAGVWRDGRSIQQVTSDAGGSELFGVQLARIGPILLPDVFDTSQDNDPRIASFVPALPGLRKYWERAHILSVGMFPILFQDRVIGEISFSSSTPRTFDRDEVDFLRALVVQAATTIKGLRLLGELERSRLELQRSEERFRSLVQHASDLVTVIQADTTVTYQSPAIAQILGCQPEQIISRKLIELVHPDDRAAVARALEKLMVEPAGTVAGEGRFLHRNGQWRHLEFVGSDQRENPAIEGLVLNVRDVTERRLLEDQLRHQALHDPLTHLANRTRFSERLEHALVRAERVQTRVAVLFMDLDNFKGVNDTLGHTSGDRLLTQVAERVQMSVRAADTVARLGGDEFAILLEDVAGIADTAEAAARILDDLRQPFVIDEKELLVRASIGIAVGSRSTSSTEDLLRNADTAMYVAKAHGKGRYEIFEESMQRSMLERLELLADLQRAIEHEEFVLHYQPVVLLESGRLFGVEALVRWEHPRRGLVPPAEFISLAEESGAILALGRWVLFSACRQAAAWLATYPARPQWTLSVNVSARQLHQPAFVREVAQALDESGLPPEMLILEITESVMMQDADLMMARLRDLKDLGVRLAVDDFGTGYSSLSYLRQFPFDMLKIDKSFIDDVSVVPAEKELTRAIIELGKTLNLDLVAEGIERTEQLSRLRALDCDLGQGFYFARPMTAQDVGSLLSALSGADTEAA